MCSYGADGKSTAYYDKYGHEPGERISPNCECRQCRAKRPAQQWPQHPIRAQRNQPLRAKTARAAHPNRKSTHDRIEQTFHFAAYGDEHDDIEVQCSRGHWFIRCLACGAMWSAEPCNEPAATDGWYFEIMDEGDGYCCHCDRDERDQC